MNFQPRPINAASPTPLDSEGGCDIPSTRRLCRRWLDIQLDGVLLLGSMGEGLLLADETRSRFLETAIAEVAGRISIYASAADLSRSRMRERARRYASMGASCIAFCVAPGSAPRAAVADMLALADSCPLPCLYYEVPARTGVSLTLNEILEIAAHPNVCAIKDSTGNPLLAQALNAREHAPQGVAVFDGTEYRVSYSASAGYTGVIHGGGTLTGYAVRQIWELSAQGRWPEAFALDRRVALLLGAIYNRFSRPLQNIVGQKYALEQLGVFQRSVVVEPQEMNDDSRRRVEQVIGANPHLLHAPQGVIN